MKLAKTHDYCATKQPKLTAVLIHGIASNSSTYDHALHYLESQDELKDVRFVTFDLLGSGQSEASDDFNYDYSDQLGALDSSLADLKIDTPLVLVRHSLGTFIVTRYADTHKKSVDHLVLISPPVYTEQDFDNPEFAAGIKNFESAVSAKNPSLLTAKSFRNSMDKIVLDKRNYKVLAELSTPATLIYGDKDQLIGAHNIPGVLEANGEHLRAIKTEGSHGVTRDKYTALGKVLEEILHI